jgi:hypothetical protein
LTVNGHTQIPRSEGGSIREAHFQRAKRAIAGIIKKIDHLYMKGSAARRISRRANFGVTLQEKEAWPQRLRASRG